jgi:Ca-activated chloride channel family protein
VDAGDIGAGHHVTALYELSLAGTDAVRLPPLRYADAHAAPRSGAGDRRSQRRDEIAHLRLRYKRPGEERSQLVETPIARSEVVRDWRGTSTDFRFAAAVAAFGQKLRGGEYLEQWSWDDIAAIAAGARGDDPFGYRGEFLRLVRLAETVAGPDRVASLSAGE